jgi:hypothetical protein
VGEKNYVETNSNRPIGHFLIDIEHRVNVGLRVFLGVG